MLKISLPLFMLLCALGCMIIEALFLYRRWTTDRQKPQRVNWWAAAWAFVIAWALVITSCSH